MTNPRSLMLLMPLPSSGLIPQEVHKFLVRLRFSFMQLGVDYEEIILPGMDQAQCRAELLAYYYARRDKYEDALFLDSDMLTGVDVIHELGRLSDEIVLCPYPQRGRDSDPSLVGNPLARWAMAVDTAGENAFIEIREGRRMIPIRGAGLGCCRLRRSAVEKLWNASRERYRGGDPANDIEYLTPHWMSKVPGMVGTPVRGLFECITHMHTGSMTRRPEDMSFFQRCLDEGMQPYALCDATMWHAGKPAMSLWESLCGRERDKKKIRRRVDFQLADCPDNLAAGLCEVLDGAYDIEGLELKAGETILDIGANVGAFAVWASERFPGSTVYCFEPEPTNYERLEKNTEFFDNVICRRAAVCNTKGMPEAKLYPGPSNDGEWTIRPVEGIHDVAKPVTVQTTPAKNLPPCAVLKIDTEGCEVEILQEYRWLDDCKAVMLEWHSPADYPVIMRFMLERGFAPMVDRARGNPNTPHRELCFLKKNAFAEMVEEDRRVREELPQAEVAQ